ncbi:toll/interleukin-1 receptor domain-containing protein [Ruficoccus sp. ZRK36]|uniref:toll/interleukin-1 receptor domain-containing protein n=1 Tax=Ruficoccus sp. ZRK36 TaxID=2866311 RepID=UPI001C73193F|nr:toll/interleukin-1 receptor domain-containing protein [Ruficoccus sp. ZRK36]QYY36869.1 toll/interleukin-1 receptor domain-containing protein [Ruficoccus sp. ZRK36]
MKVFISYSVADTALVWKVSESIKDKAEVIYWEDAHRPGNQAWEQIATWIDGSDLVLVIITDRTVNRAMSVGQEVGHARRANKRIVPLVASTVDIKDLGFLAGITYISLDMSDAASALASLQREVDKFSKEVQQKRAQLEHRKSNQEGVVALAGIALLLYMLSQN